TTRRCRTAASSSCSRAASAARSSPATCRSMPWSSCWLRASTPAWPEAAAMEGGIDIHLPAWLAVAAILLLMAISAVFSMGETALTASSRPRLHALARKGHPRAKLVDELRERQDEVLSAMLLGNNLVNVVASALATGALIALFGQAGVAYAAAIMTVLI